MIGKQHAALWAGLGGIIAAIGLGFALAMDHQQTGVKRLEIGESTEVKVAVPASASATQRPRLDIRATPQDVDGRNQVVLEVWLLAKDGGQDYLLTRRPFYPVFAGEAKIFSVPIPADAAEGARGAEITLILKVVPADDVTKQGAVDIGEIRVVLGGA
jgi:hypothetical protein